MDIANSCIPNNIERISLQACLLDGEDMPAIDQMLDSVLELEKHSEDCDCTAFSLIVQAIKQYLDGLKRGHVDDVQPLSTGVQTLQAIWRYLAKGQEFTFDISGDLDELNFLRDDKSNTDGATDSTKNACGSGKTQIAEDDVSVFGEFIAESREHLQSIEIHLIEIEQDPGNMDILNAVFRTFHTMKGVSGFLKLDKINMLCHYTENLMEIARSGEIFIDARIADLILEAVDTLQLMLDELEQDIEKRLVTSFEDIDIDNIIEKIKAAEADGNLGESLGSILVKSGSITKEDLRESLKIQKKNPDAKLGEIMLEERKVEPDHLKTALKSQGNGNHSTNLQVKVDTSKLDNLVDLTGELVIAQSMLKRIGHDMSKGDLKYFQQLNQVTQAVTAIQKIAMSMRMVPIKNTFQKMFRIVRDLSKTSGKEVDLLMFGEETEIDRNMVDELYEPLVHIIRNSVDHGLEMGDERVAAGKPPKGLIRLSAFQKGGNIVIEVKDDGRGLNKDRIFEKAVEKNLVSKEENLSDKEIYHFIMKPGFSTAKEITEISGRGVGMDVVKEGIEKLRGRLDIDSEPGKGTTLTISLPLTLAIMDGMLVSVGKEKYILPSHSIIESFRPEKNTCHKINQKGEVIQHRGNLIPVIRIGRLFDVDGGTLNPWDGIIVVVESNGEQKAILLDELLGKDEFVIKSIGKTFKGIKAVAGGAILSDGQVGLIIDIPGLFETSVREGRC